MEKKLVIPLLILILSLSVFSQTVTKPAKSEKDAKLEKEAVEFLRETLVDVNNMRSLENRLSFGAEMASLMWFHDEKEARTMYMGVVGDFKQLLAGYDAQMNSIATAAATTDDDYYPGGMFTEITDKARVQRKFRTAMTLRQQIALSLAEHEPDMALTFYYDSVAVLTNPEFHGQTDERDTGFEFRLMSQVAQTNAGKAAEFGKRSLDDGVTYQHLDLLKKIYAKDQEKGADFASAIVSHLKSDGAKQAEVWVVTSLMTFGEETLGKSKVEAGRKPVLTAQDLRDLAEVLAQAILSRENGDAGGASIELIEKYAPGRAAQIKAKLRSSMAANSVPTSGYYTAISNTSNVAVNAPVATASSNANVAIAERRAKAMEEREAAEKKFGEDLESIGTKPLAKDERDKIVAQARKIISQTPGRDQKIGALSMLAAQVAKAGDKELAAEIMKDAESLVNPEPKNYQEFLLSAMLASGYANVDAEKAFPLLTNTILRLNETISAFVKAAEFIDVQGEIVDDGEVQVGEFGGSILRELSGELNVATPTIRKLAESDFAKTKGLANTFDRPEVRVLAKMLVLRAILGDDKKDKDIDESDARVVTNRPR